MNFESHYEADLYLTTQELDELIEALPRWDATRHVWKIQLHALRDEMVQRAEDGIALNYVCDDYNGDKEEGVIIAETDHTIDLDVWYMLEEWVWQKLNGYEVSA